MLSLRSSTTISGNWVVPFRNSPVSEDEACAAGGASVSAHAKPGKAGQKLPANAKSAKHVLHLPFLLVRMKFIACYTHPGLIKKRPRTSSPSSDGL
jgi:hypothetical protein